MLKVDRSELDAVLTELEKEIFPATKKAIADYHAEKSVLEERESELNKQLTNAKAKHLRNLMMLDEAIQDVKTTIKLKKENVKLNEEAEIIEGLLAEMKEEYSALRLKHSYPIQETYSKELSALRKQFDAKYQIDFMIYELLKAVSDYAGTLNRQHRLMLNEFEEFKQDEELMQTNKGFKWTVAYDAASLDYYESKQVLVRTGDVRLALGGNIPSEIRKPIKKEGE